MKQYQTIKATICTIVKTQFSYSFKTNSSIYYKRDTNLWCLGILTKCWTLWNAEQISYQNNFHENYFNGHFPPPIPIKDKNSDF